MCLLVHQLVFSVDDIKSALRRRGPDNLGAKKIYLKSKIRSSVEEQEIYSCIEGEEAAEKEYSYLLEKSDFFSSCSEQSHKLENVLVHESVAELLFIGATLQLRGVNPISQPLVDSCRNILVYNGMSCFQFLFYSFLAPFYTLFLHAFDI